MSDSASPTFPPDGKVIVISMTVDTKLSTKLGDRVHWKSPWDYLGKEPVPSGVVALILPHAMKPDMESRMRNWARRGGIKIVEVVPTREVLVKQLFSWFKLDESGNSSAAPASVPTKVVQAVRPLPPAPVKPTVKAEARYTPPVDVKPTPPLILVSPPRSSDPEAWVVGSRLHERVDPVTGEIWIKTRRIRRFKKQPRTRFSKLTMNELIVSIKSRGQIMPILVRRIEGDPDYDYELIEGERRLRACLFLNIEEMKASIQIVENVREQYTNSFVANFQREPHTPLETGRGIKEMMDYPEHRDLPKMEALAVIAGYVGKTAMWAYGYLQLLDLPEEVQLLLEPEDESKKALPQAMGRFLLTIKSREIQLATCKKVVSEDLSVSEAKHFARRLAAEAGVQVGSHNRTPNREYLILRNCLRNAKTGLEQTLTMPHRTVDELFLNRDLADRNDVLREIDDLSTLLEQLRAKVTIRKVTKTA